MNIDNFLDIIDQCDNGSCFGGCGNMLTDDDTDAFICNRCRTGEKTQEKPKPQHKCSHSRRVSFADSAKNHDGMKPETVAYDQFMTRIVEQGMPVQRAMTKVPEEFRDSVKNGALDFTSRYNQAWRANIRRGIPILPTGGGACLKIQTHPDHRRFVESILKWCEAIYIQRAWKIYKARKAAIDAKPTDKDLVRKKREEARLRVQTEALAILRRLRDNFHFSKPKNLCKSKKTKNRSFKLHITTGPPPSRRPFRAESRKRRRQNRRALEKVRSGKKEKTYNKAGCKYGRVKCGFI